MMTAPVAGGAAVSATRSGNVGSTVANQFLAAWDTAWGNHDANALGEPSVVTPNPANGKQPGQG